MHACAVQISNMLTGLPIPIVAISAGIAHDQYGNNDRWATFRITVVNIVIYVDVGYLKRKVPFGDLLVQCY